MIKFPMKCRVQAKRDLEYVGWFDMKPAERRALERLWRDLHPEWLGVPHTRGQIKAAVEWHADHIEKWNSGLRR